MLISFQLKKYNKDLALVHNISTPMNEPMNSPTGHVHLQYDFQDSFDRIELVRFSDRNRVIMIRKGKTR